MEKKALELRIIGRVQGVYYRGSTKQKADELGLSGWVKNESNGEVSIAVEGAPELVDQFVAWCAQGPPMAAVRQVIPTSTNAKHYSKFTILR